MCCNLNSCPCGLSIFFYHILLQGWLMLQHPGVFWQSSSCSRNVSELDMAARNEMRFDDSFSDSERCSAEFGLWNFDFCQPLNSMNPTQVVFLWKMTHHFDIICIYPAMYVLMITKILHQLRPGRQYTLLFSYRVLYMPDPRCYKLSAKLECSCVIYCNTDFAWIFVAQVLAIAFV